MIYGQVPGINKPVSRLVQGTVMVTSADEDYAFRLLDDIFALGGNTFDTAHVYGNGDNERTFGRWVASRGLRDQIVILGKGAHHNQDRRRVTPFDISADIHDSLARMQVSHIDLYILHRDDPTVPVGPIVEVLNEHQAAGRIRAFGGSNWSHERIQQANEYAQQHGLIPFAVSSPNFSLADQVREPWENCISIGAERGRAAREWYAQTGLAVFAWSSLAGGFFSGRFRRDNLNSFSEYLDVLCVNSYCYEDNFRRLDRVEALAEAKGLSLPQVAMAYVMSQPMNIFALVGCKNGDEFRANIAALELRLTPEEIAWLELQTDTQPTP
jgi:aryl-alcohol dehydrogenase-like predicted oxidoreductase